MRQLQSEISMFIKPGSNFRGIAAEIESFLTQSVLQEYSCPMHNKDQYVLCSSGAWGTSYYLVKSSSNLKALTACKPRTTTKQFMSKYVEATDVIGYVQVVKGPLDEIDIVWVNDPHQGRGYGEGLLRLAFALSKHGIKTSTDIGTMMLASYIRLYQKESKMQLFYDEDFLFKIDRTEVKIKGTDIWVNKTNLCDPNTKDFWFQWCK